MKKKKKKYNTDSAARDRESESIEIGGSGKKTAHRFSKSWFFLAVILLCVIIVRVRLSEFPLERDEGEYAYMGQLLLQGQPPYHEAYTMKLPGVSMMYALMMSIFGQSIQGVHLGFMVVNCVTIVLVFLLAKKLVSESAALAASAAYTMLSLSSSVFGFAAHATHFVVLTALGGAVALLHGLENNRLRTFLGSGVLFGLALLMKQPGIFFFLFGALYILYHFVSSWPERFLGKLVARLGVFSLGAALPLVAVVAWVFFAGVFDTFWFWTVKYAEQYGSLTSLAAGVRIFTNKFSTLIEGFSFLWVLAAFGFIAMFFWKGPRANKVFIFFLGLFSFFSVCPGFYFREHYFVTFLPAISLFVGIFIDVLITARPVSFQPRVLTFIAWGIFVAAGLTGIIGQKEYFFVDDPVELSRSTYGKNPFPEAIVIADFIKARSTVNDTIAVLGSEPEIFFYSHRHSATGYIYTYGLMEKHDYSLVMQKEMVHEIEMSKPKFIVHVQVFTSWLRKSGSDAYIFNWLAQYVKDGYRLVGIADIVSPSMTVYKWNDDVKNYTVQSQAYLLVYERGRERSEMTGKARTEVPGVV